jgi:hypothetical protein
VFRVAQERNGAMLKQHQGINGYDGCYQNKLLRLSVNSSKAFGTSGWLKANGLE